MTHPQDIDFDNIPILTEQVGEAAEIPVLIETVTEEAAPIAEDAATPDGLTDAECQRLAAQIAPQLEALLRNKLAAQLDTLWQEAWREVQAKLPEMIRAQLATAQTDDSSAGIIAPLSATPTNHDQDGTC